MIGRVYKISSKDKTYIGSTTQTLEQRLLRHRKDYTYYLDGKQCYITSYEVLKDEHTIELIYEGEFETETHLHRMEGEYQRKIDCVNRCIAGRTKEEYYQDHKEEIKEQRHIYHHTNKEECNKISREYYQDNKEDLLEQKKQYYQDHKEAIQEKRKEKITCICGSVCRIDCKTQHERSKKHKDFLNFINTAWVLGQTDYLLPAPMSHVQLLGCMFSPEWSHLQDQVS